MSRALFDCGEVRGDRLARLGVVDHVLLHELCHLLELSHRPEFWRTLERALPDWRERKEELHRRAADIYWCAPELVQ